MSSQKPQPRINSINRTFWSDCKDDKLTIQQCEASACRRWFYFPRVGCPYCGSMDISWKQASGEGTIITYTVIRRPQHSSFFPDAPYYFIAVRLKEGPLIYSRLQQAYTPELELIGKPVTAVFTEHGPDQKIPFFAVSKSSNEPLI